MITEVRIRNFKAFRESPWIKLDSFHVLVGPNGSGKSTFLDVFEFTRDCLTVGPAAAVSRRAPEFRDLNFNRARGPIELEFKFKLPTGECEYRFALIGDRKLGVRVEEESLRRGEMEILGKNPDRLDRYRRESSRAWDTFNFGPTKLALSQTPADLERYPTGNAARELLTTGVRFLQLDSVGMRQPVAATAPSEMALDGTNLPRVVGQLLALRNGLGKKAVENWTNHVRYALADLESIRWTQRKADNAEYLLLHFQGGLECPTWLLSDGTLRTLALTLPAFLPPAGPEVYMIEEPENGVHPHALEVIVQALSSIPNAQVFLATHSPLVVQQAGLDPLLCFRRTPERGVQVIRAASHPAMKDWMGTPSLASIFASRVLG